MRLPQNAILGLITGYLGRLRFPQLFALMGLFFLVDLMLPDLIPFVDEVLLGLATLLFGSWKRERESRQGRARPRAEQRSSSHLEPDGPVIDVEPENDPGSGRRDN